ncbi:MAG: S8 family serine peptidase, partial [Thermotaleaceae bacterium]
GPAFGTINCPGNSSSAITVGAVYLDGKKLADISSRGRYGQSKPDLVTSGYIYVKDTKDIQYGTSFAAPIITGVAASIFDLYKEPNLVKSIIMNATDNIGYPYHEQGKGMFNIKKLVEVLSVGETNYRN